MNPANHEAGSPRIASLEQRQDIDIQDLIKLIASTAVEWELEWATDLVAEVRQTAARHRQDACGHIGQFLMRWADSEMPRRDGESACGGRRHSWRQRLARWLTKEN